MIHQVVEKDLPAFFGPGGKRVYQTKVVGYALALEVEGSCILTLKKQREAER